MRRISVLIALAYIASACATPAALTSSVTVFPSNTAAPLPTLTPTATVSLPVSKGTAVPNSSEPISVENLDRLTLLAERPSEIGYIDDLTVSPDGSLLAIYNGQDPKALIVNLDTGAKVWSLDELTNFVPPRAVSFSPDGSLIQILCGIYQTDDGTLVHQFSTSAYLMDSCSSLTFFPDGTKVAVGRGYEVNIWSVDGSEHLQTFPLFVGGEAVSGQEYTLSPDSSLLLAHDWVSNWAKNLWLFQSSDGEYVRKFEYGPHDRLGIWDLHWAFSPDGTVLAIDVTRADMYADLLYFTEMPHTLEIWRLADMTLIQQLDGLAIVCALAFSPAGDLVAERAYDRLTFRSSADWSVVGEFDVPGCWPMVFSADGTRLVAGSGNDVGSLAIRVYGAVP